MTGQEIPGPGIPNEGLYVFSEPSESGEDDSVEGAIALDGDVPARPKLKIIEY